MDETPRAAAAFREYCFLGPGRSLAKLLEHLRQSGGKVTVRLRTLETWSSQYSWQERIKAWDEEQFKAEEEAIAEERKRVLRSEYALMHKRVELLNRKVKQLVDITDDEETIWLDDVKSVGSGPGAERVDLKTFNADAFKELREYLDDIAAEMGERIKKKELSVTIIPKEYVNTPDDDGCDEEVVR